MEKEIDPIAQEISKRLALAIEKGGGFNAVVEKSKLTATSVARYLRGKADLKVSIGIRLADACNVKPEWLLLGIEPKRTCTLHTGACPVNNGRCADVPYYEKETRLLLNREPPLKTLQISYDFLQTILGMEDHSEILIEASDDTMYPTIQSGDKLLVDTQAKPKKLSGIFVVEMDGSIFIKRLLTTPTHIMVSSDNSLIPSFDVQKDKVHWGMSDNKNLFHIIGHVSCCFRSFRK